MGFTGPSVPGGAVGGGVTLRDQDFEQALGRGQHFNPPSPSSPEKVHGWLLEALQEGERINRSDPVWPKADELIAHVMGEQPTGDHPSYLHKVKVNQVRRAIDAHTSLLTDLQPLWEWRTENKNLSKHADLFNDLLLNWWVRTFADMELANGVRYAATIGAGDMALEWDPFFEGVGDIRMTARDWRDTVPIRPERDRSLQSWEGMILKELHSPVRLLATYPGKAHLIVPTSGALGGIFSRFRRLIFPVGGQQTTTTLSGLGDKDPNKRWSAQSVQPEAMLFRCFVRDRTRNMTSNPVPMGPPGRSWSYVVQPGEYLYPRGRLIVAGEKPGTFYDGPSPYISGKWPVSRLRLKPWPWLMVGMPIAHDLMPLQAILNNTINDFLEVFGQWVGRGSIWGKNTPDPIWKGFDARRKNWKVKVNNVVGTGFQLQDGPNLPPWSLAFLQFLFAKFDELSGTANLQQLLQARQIPGSDTVEAYQNALTPEVRLEGREMEASLRDVAMIYQGLAAQNYSTDRRILILGERGKLLEDLDWDPGTMIPALREKSAGYVPELDAARSRDSRAKFYLQQFTFHISPRSMLAMEAQDRKMMAVQSTRQGLMDFWTYHEILGTPNVGQPPAIPLPVDLPLGTRLAPGEQPPMELRVPVTITERLMAMQQLGIGQTVSPVGRKASGQESPQLKTKSDGSQTVSESG